MVGSTPRHTTTAQATSLYTKRCSKEKAYVCLWDIAKAYPSTLYLLTGIAPNARVIAQKLVHLIELIYQHTTHSYK